MLVNCIFARHESNILENRGIFHTVLYYNMNSERSTGTVHFLTPKKLLFHTGVECLIVKKSDVMYSVTALWSSKA
jgi:hypothetical protein